MMIATVGIAAQFNISETNVKAFISYVFGYGIRNGTDAVTTAWKDVSNVLQNIGFRNEVPGAPMTPKPEHQEFMNLLVSCSDKFLKIDSDSIEALWALSHLGQSRFLPPPSFKLSNLKIIDFIAGIAKPRVIDSTGAFELGMILGDKISDCANKQSKRLLQETHVSLSNGSCWEASRQELGKWHILKEGKAFSEFLLDRICDRFELSEDQTSYVDYFGNLVCYEPQGGMQIWKHAYLTQPLTGEMGDQYNIEGTFEDMLFSRGFDARLGQLLHSWASWMK
jgi:hypothetical protein